MPNKFGDAFDNVLYHIDPHEVASTISFVCRTWRHSALSDKIWSNLVARDFPLSNLQPTAPAKWIAVYFAEISRQDAIATPVQWIHASLSICVQLPTCSRRFEMPLVDGLHVQLEGPIRRLRKSTFNKPSWNLAKLNLSDTHVTIQGKDTSVKLHLKDLDIQRFNAQIQLRLSNATQILIEATEESIAAAWTAAIAHNMHVFFAKCNSVLPTTPLASSKPKTLETRLHLRKFHAFRFKEVFASTSSVNTTYRRPSISKDVLIAFNDKPHLSYLTSKNNSDERLHPLLSAPRCLGCGILWKDSNSKHRQFCGPKCERLQAARHCQLRTLRRACGALHLMSEPATIATALVNDNETFEGHACTQFLRSCRVKSCTTAKNCHVRLCDTRDVISNLVQYILTYRQSELSRCDIDITSESTRDAIQIGVERCVCTLLRKSLLEWSQKCVAHLDQEALKQRMKSWSTLPPTSKQFGLSGDLLLNWNTVIERLHDMELESLPSIKLRLLLASAKEIFDVHAHSSTTPAGKVLSADDFLPVFIYCVCMCQLQDPLATLEFMWSMCSEDSLRGDNHTKMKYMTWQLGEAGYYLTMLEASLEYIRTWTDIPQ